MTRYDPDDVDNTAWDQFELNDGFPDPSDIDICPAGGPHTPTNDSSHPDRMTDPYWHCAECGALLPTPEGGEP
jgi:hypothetical protein